MKFTIDYVTRHKERGSADLTVRIGRNSRRAVLVCTFRNGSEKQITDGEYIRIGTAKEDPGVLIFTPGNARNAYKLSRKQQEGAPAVLKVYADDIDRFAQFCHDYKSILFDKESGVHYVRTPQKQEDAE